MLHTSGSVAYSTECRIRSVKPILSSIVILKFERCTTYGRWFHGKKLQYVDRALSMSLLAKFQIKFVVLHLFAPVPVHKKGGNRAQRDIGMVSYGDVLQHHTVT